MTPTEGVKRIKKLLGSKAAWRDNGHASSEETRETAKAAAVAAKAEYESLKGKRDDLMRRLLDNQEYQALVQQTKDARQAWEEQQGRTHRYKIRVGTVEGGFLMVKADGDNWADVVRKLEAEVKARAS